MVKIMFPDVKEMTIEEVERYCEAFPSLSIIINDGKQITFILGEE